MYVCRVMLSSWQLNSMGQFYQLALSPLFFDHSGNLQPVFFSGKPLLGGERKGVPADVLWLSLTLYTNHH